VVDGWPRVPVDDYDYRALAGQGDVICMDWDTAVGLEDLTRFAREAAAAGGNALVAPVRTYYGPRPGQWNLTWADGRIVGEHERPAMAFGFGFGLVYLPHHLIASYIEAHPGERLTDPVFSSWHLEATGRGVRVCWSVRPVHLHYPAAISGHLQEAQSDAA
jgi:hypothetical protein